MSDKKIIQITDKKLDEINKNMMRLHIAIKALHSIASDDFICGEYYNKGDEYHLLSEKEIAIKALKKLK